MSYVEFKDSHGQEPTNINFVSTFNVMSDGFCHDLSLDFDPAPLTPYFLVVVEYTTGDSCGSQGGNLAYVGLYKNKDVAFENAKRIRAHYTAKNDFRQTRHDVPSLVLQNDDLADDERPTSTGRWTGYFEQLDELRVIKLELSNNDEWSF